MCGIVGATAERRVAEILLEGLRRLEYRGYDSANIAVLNDQGLQELRRVGKVQALATAQAETGMNGHVGIAHTRWATHGKVTKENAHPHVSSDTVAVVHNGIIENHEALRVRLQGLGYTFQSETDTEVICHLVHHELENGHSLLDAVKATVKQLEGAYGTVIMDQRELGHLVVARSGSPLVIGLGIGENFVASDQLALLPVTREFMYLEEGDVASVTCEQVDVYDVHGNAVQRDIQTSDLQYDAGGKGEYRHYMLKEIFEQPIAMRNTLEGRINGERIAIDAFGNNAEEVLKDIKHVQIIACGTSYHAGMVARYWLEQYAGVSCNV